MLEQYDSLKTFVEQRIAFVARSALSLEEAKPGFARCRMPLANNENHMHSMYAGAQFTLADITGGVLALVSFDRERFYPTLKDLHIEFKQPARSDLTCTMRIDKETLEQLREQADREGKARFQLHGELCNTDDEVVAVAKGEFQVRALNR